MKRNFGLFFVLLNLAEIIAILYCFDWSRASKRIWNTVNLMGLGLC